MIRAIHWNANRSLEMRLILARTKKNDRSMSRSNLFINLMQSQWFRCRNHNLYIQIWNTMRSHIQTLFISGFAVHPHIGQHRHLMLVDVWVLMLIGPLHNYSICPRAKWYNINDVSLTLLIIAIEFQYPADIVRIAVSIMFTFIALLPACATQFYALKFFDLQIGMCTATHNTHTRHSTVCTRFALKTNNIFG